MSDSKKWHPFDPSKGYRQKRPKEKKHVLTLISGVADKGVPHSIVVGYMKNAAGDKSSPYFVTAGCNFNHEYRVIAWCDCLGDEVGGVIAQAYMQFL